MAAMATPKVFISYSHDSPAHKAWVLELAGYLRTNGIDVIIDAWDARLGKDLPKFMEDSVSSADRVLMICTERYVLKADTAAGGVGYEKMMVTAELIKDLDTTRFVPVIRQTTADRQLPKFMGGRRYIDLSEGEDVAAARTHLLRELHNVPPDRPPLGVSPFAAPAAASPPAAAPTSHAGATTTVVDTSDPMSVYQRSLSLARADDLFAWRKLQSNCRDGALAGLDTWWKKYQTVVPNANDLVQESMVGIATFAPLMALTLGGLASMSTRFKNQGGVLDDILHPAGWQQSGYVERTNLPMAAAFIFQALHGSMCVYIEDLANALKIARTRTQPPTAREELPLWQRHDVTMWPYPLGHSASTAWKVISTLPTTWPWVDNVFGNSKDFQTGLLAYYLALNTLDFLERLAAGQTISDNPSTVRQHIVPIYESIPDDIKRSAYRSLVSFGGEFRALGTELKLDLNLIRGEWPKWVQVQAMDIHGLYPFAMGQVMQERLIPDLFGK
jgi:hypothetical protein